MNVFSMKDMRFSYGGRPLFTEASIEIPAGAITGIIGANGAGKTTFFDMLSGLVRIEDSVCFDHEIDLLYLSQIITVPPALTMAEIYRLIANLSGRQPLTEVELFARFKQISSRLAHRYITLWSKRSCFCSYGEVRSFLALSLLTLPADLYILDEPTAGIDLELQHYVWLAARHACEAGASVVVSSHNIEEIANNCNTFHMLRNQSFTPFRSGAEYMETYAADNLVQAFLNALETESAPAHSSL